jgi:Cd2+/Zn2+-exporting ATPase
MDTLVKTVPTKRGIHYSFRDFVESGGDESNSPFLQPASRKIALWMGLPRAFFSALLLAISWSLSPQAEFISFSYILLAIVYFLSGTKSLEHTFEDLVNLEINIDVLMTLAAYLCLGMGSGFEGALLLVMFDISRNMEQGVNQKARQSLMSLREVAPEKAWFVEGDDLQKIKRRHVQDIQVGQLIQVKAGEIVPLDGILESEKASFSTAHLTGEAMPVVIEKGNSVFSGSQVIDQAVLIRVKVPSHEGTLSQIIRLINEAQESKPKLQRTFDKLSDTYAKSIISLSALFAATLPFILSIEFWGNQGSLYRALSFLIAASPCALILAVPIAYLSALSACAKKGIVLKGGSIFDALASCKQVAFDKTGTLTRSEPKVIKLAQIGDLPSWTPPAILVLEQQTEHPLARAIVTFLKKDPAQTLLPVLKEVKMQPGAGISASIENQRLRVGSFAFAFDGASDQLKAQVKAQIEAFKKEGFLVVCASLNESACLFALEDQLRQGMKQAIEKLSQRLHMQCWMLTGDHEDHAQKTAHALGISHWKASLKPEHKLELIQKLTQTAPLAMVGDGVNDAPALAGASVGIAMAGVGSSAAAHAADVLLLDDDPSQLPWLFEKAGQTKRVIWQNLSLAALAILIASTSALLGLIPLWMAVVAHEGGTILVGLNGLRLIQTHQGES